MHNSLFLIRLFTRKSLFVIRDSLRKTQTGEIATILTLISVGLMLLGVTVGKVAVEQTTRTESKAQISSDCQLVLCKGPELKAWLNLPDAQISGNSVYLSTDGAQFYTNSSCNVEMGDDEGRRICTASSATTTTPAASPTNSRSTCENLKCKDIYGNSANGETISRLGEQYFAGANCIDSSARSEPDLETFCGGTTVTTCKPGNTWYKCIEGGTCPYDNRVGIGYPYLCADDGKTSTNMNPAGECTWACQPPNQPTPKPNTKCDGKDNGSIINDCSMMQCAPNPDKNNKTYWIKIEEACQNGAVYGKPGAFTDMECTLKSGYEIFAGCDGNSQNPPKPTEVQDKRVPGSGPPSTNTSTTGTSSNICFPYQCSDGSGKKFSVKGGKLYDSDDCTGDPLTAFSGVCAKKSGTGCDFVSGGGTGTGKCVDNIGQCTGNGLSGKGHDVWGPNNNQANIQLCSGLSGKICCEPEGGFKPAPLPTIGASSPGTSTVGTEGTCFIDYPNNILADTPFSITARYVKRNLTVSGAKLNFTMEGSSTNPPPNINAEFIKKRILNNNPNTWEESNWTFKDIKLPEGKYTLRFTHNKGEDDGKSECSFTPQITVKSKSSASPTPTPNLSAGQISADCELRKYIKPLSDNCTACILSNDTVAGKINATYNQASYRGCTATQKANVWCATNPTVCGEYMDTPACKKEGICYKNSIRSIFPIPLSFTNPDFQAFIDAKHDAYENSLYVTAATRSPGLQREYCNPDLKTAPGGCEFGTSSQIQT